MLVITRPVDESSPESPSTTTNDDSRQSKRSSKKLFESEDNRDTQHLEDEKENVSGASNGASVLKKETLLSSSASPEKSSEKSRKRKRQEEDVREPSSKRITDFFSATPKMNSEVASVSSTSTIPELETSRKELSTKSKLINRGLLEHRRSKSISPRKHFPEKEVTGDRTKSPRKLKIDSNPVDNKESKENGKEDEKGEEDEDEDEEEEYEVERIDNYSYCKEREEGLYFVKWVGWSEDDNTWEPLANLDCREKLIEFYNKRVEERRLATGPEKRKLSLPPDPRDSNDLRDLFLEKYWKKPGQDTLHQLLQLKKQNKLAKLQPESQLNKEMELLATASKASEKRIENIVNQLNIREFEKIRRKQIADIKAWQTEINSIDKDVLVSVVNDVDLEGPPTTMKYINGYKATEGIEIPDDPPLGCECKECKIGSSDCCPGQAGYDFPYLANGKLRLNIGFPIYECNKRCSCPPTCRNRVVQKGRTTRLAIFRTDNGCGWGVKTLDRIKEGTFVVQYAGEVITSEEAERRGKEYDAAGRTYLFDLDFNLGDDNPYTVDAANFGNLSHFINHSCDPNLNIFNVYINCLDPNLPQLCLFASRDIDRGEQLTFDYCQSTQSLDNENQDSNLSQTPKNADKPRDTPVKNSGKKEFSRSSLGGNRTECRCGSANCRKVLF